MKKIAHGKKTRRSAADSGKRATGARSAAPKSQSSPRQKIAAHKQEFWCEQVRALGFSADTWANVHRWLGLNDATRLPADDPRRSRSLAVARVLKAAFDALLLEDDEELQAQSDSARRYLDRAASEHLAKHGTLMVDASAYQPGGWFVVLGDAVGGAKRGGVDGRLSSAQIERNTLAWHLKRNDSTEQLADQFLTRMASGPLSSLLAEQNVTFTVDGSQPTPEAKTRVLKAFRRRIDRTKPTETRQTLAESLLILGLQALGVSKDAAHGLFKAEAQQEKRQALRDR